MSFLVESLSDVGGTSVQEKLKTKPEILAFIVAKYFCCHILGFIFSLVQFANQICYADAIAASRL